MGCLPLHTASYVYIAFVKDIDLCTQNESKHYALWLEMK